jgi:hypothetical protein
VDRGIRSIEQDRDRVTRREERRPENRRPDRRGRLRMARGRRVKQVRLVAEPEQPVVVGEVQVAVEGERSQI